MRGILDDHPGRRRRRRVYSTSDVNLLISMCNAIDTLYFIVRIRIRTCSSMNNALYK